MAMQNLHPGDMLENKAVVIESYNSNIVLAMGTSPAVRDTPYMVAYHLSDGTLEGGLFFGSVFEALAAYHLRIIESMSL